MYLFCICYVFCDVFCYAFIMCFGMHFVMYFGCVFLLCFHSDFHNSVVYLVMCFCHAFGYSLCCDFYEFVVHFVMY